MKPLQAAPSRSKSPRSDQTFSVVRVCADRDIYVCVEWVGFNCRAGGWGVIGATRINLLISACPVACADVTTPSYCS
jgi:hypothetical protein